jgi:hypothetical protein
MRLLLHPFLPLALCAVIGCVHADDKPASRELENDHVKMRLAPRTPQQVAAFYLGRGFPSAMVDLIKRKCFITVSIHNKSRDVVWLELHDWRFISDTGDIERIPRKWWKHQWRDMNAPMANQSTFRWTLLPETLDFQPDEREGGNLVLPQVTGSFALEARFATGQDKRGGTVTLRFDNLRCAEDKAP